MWPGSLSGCRLPYGWLNGSVDVEGVKSQFCLTCFLKVPGSLEGSILLLSPTWKFSVIAPNMLDRVERKKVKNKNKKKMKRDTLYRHL